MCFPHNGNSVTIDHLSFITPNSCLIFQHVTPLSVPILMMDSPPPQVNYVVTYPIPSIANEKEPLTS